MRWAALHGLTRLPGDVLGQYVEPISQRLDDADHYVRRAAWFLLRRVPDAMIPGGVKDRLLTKKEEMEVEH